MSPESLLRPVMICALLTAGSVADSLFESRTILAQSEGEGAWSDPKLAITAKGTALVVFQKRVSHDWGDPVSPQFIRSEDAGKHWSKPSLLLPSEFMDAERFEYRPTATVCNRDTHELFVFIARSPITTPDGDKIPQRWRTSRLEKMRSWGKSWLLVSSKDEGRTWSAPVDLTSQLLVQPHWQAWAPVNTGLQISAGPQKGRLVVPVTAYCPSTASAGFHPSFLRDAVIFSDDGGKTWTPGTPTGSHGGGATLAELPGGMLYLSQRHVTDKDPKRWCSYSTDGGANFGPSSVTDQPDCRTHLGLTAFLLEGRPVFLATHMLEPNGERLVLSLVRNAGRKWNPAREIIPTPCTYSEIAVHPDGIFLCIFESGPGKRHTEISLARFDLEWILEDPEER